MSNNDSDHFAEIRAVHQKVEELQKASSSAHNLVAKKKKAFEKSKKLLEEAEAAAASVDSQIAAIAPEQKKAMQKVLSIIAKNPSLGHDLIGRVLDMTSGNSSSDAKPTQMDLLQNESDAPTEEDETEVNSGSAEI